MSNKSSVSLLFLAMAVSFAGAFSGSGSGTAASPYIVTTASQLQEINNDLSAYYELVNDIDLSSWGGNEGWQPIGGNDTGHKFDGNFDGGGYVISNLYINRPDSANIGLFGHIGSGAVIENTGLIDAEVIGARGTGTLVGRVTGNENTHIRECYSRKGTNNKGSVIGNGATGGLVGSNNSYVEIPSNKNHHPTIEYCWADIDVSWSQAGNGDKIGGLAGCNQKGRIHYSYALGSVTVDNSYEHTNPTPERVGGLAGCILIRGYITNSYSAGKVTTAGSVNYVGGMVGNGGTGGSNGETFNCFWDTDSSTMATSSPPESDCTPKTTSEMKTESTFTDANWDFTNTWYMETDGYPRLDGVGDGRGIEIAGIYVSDARRLCLYDFEYDVEVKVKNTGDPISDAIVSLASTPDNITVIYGTITVGEMDTGDEVFSDDLLTVQIDRENPTDTDSVVWNASKTLQSVGTSSIEMFTTGFELKTLGSDGFSEADIIRMAESWLASDGGAADKNNDGIVDYIDFALAAFESINQQ